MKKINYFYILFSLLIISALGYQGCSEIKENLVTAPQIGIHPSGWTDTTSGSFHGKYIFNNKAWNLNECKTCHGSDYRGGNTGASCYDCHTGSGGPQNCRLCHGGTSGRSYPPKALNGETSVSSLGVGVHAYHMDSVKYSAMVECSECHTSLSDGFSSPNHIGNTPDGIAEINFGPLAKTITVFEGGQFEPDPVWDRGTATCSNSYCHGNFKDGNLNSAPKWTDRESVKCGSCHGDPVTGNPNPLPNGNFFHPHFSNFTINTCYQCHGLVINPDGTIIDPEKHVNGVVNFNSR